MATSIMPLRFKAGEDYRKQLTFYPEGVVTDLSTGWAAKLQVRTATIEKGGTVLAEFVDSNGTIDLGAEGSVLLQQTAETTSEWEWDTGVYELMFIRDSDDRVFKPLEGTAYCAEAIVE